jgi:hypothetical protein
MECLEHSNGGSPCQRSVDNPCNWGEVVSAGSNLWARWGGGEGRYADVEVGVWERDGGLAIIVNEIMISSYEVKENVLWGKQVCSESASAFEAPSEASRSCIVHLAKDVQERNFRMEKPNEYFELELEQVWEWWLC